MSMFTVMGKVVHVFDQPGRLDKETGEMLPDTVRLQMMGQMPVDGGETRLDLITVKIDSKETYEKLKGKEIRLPIGAFAPSKGQVLYFVPKGSQPELVA
jgi:hypothetical protein